MKQDLIITVAINNLCEYKRAKTAIVNLREELCVVNNRLTSPRGATLSVVPTHGGGNAHEDAMLNGFDTVDDIHKRIENNRHIIAIMERGLAKLSPDEREVIRLMYIDGNVNAYGAGLQMHRCKTRIYEIRNSGLYKLYYCVHGIKKSGKKAESFTGIS